MALEQFLMATHTPQDVYQGQGSAQSEVLPDWLNCRYIDIHERVVEFVLHTITETDLGEPDGIAYTYYGDSRWWWLICSYNGIVNPMTDMVPGDKLRVPILQHAQMSLQSPPDANREDRRGRTVTI